MLHHAQASGCLLPQAHLSKTAQCPAKKCNRMSLIVRCEVMPKTDEKACALRSTLLKRQNHTECALYRPRSLTCCILPGSLGTALLAFASANALETLWLLLCTLLLIRRLPFSHHDTPLSLQNAAAQPFEHTQTIAEQVISIQGVSRTQSLGDAEL